jgi:hypothetical protein
VSKCSVLLLFSTLSACDPRTPEGEEAKKRADALKVVPGKVPPSYAFPSGRIERVRPRFPGSSQLLFWESHTQRVFEYDTDSHALVEAGARDWELATGLISDYVQIGPANGHPPYNDQLEKYIGRTPEPKVSAQYVVRLVWSPKKDKLAVVSADGKFHPQVTGLMFGGRNAYVDGPHYVEIRDSKTGALLMPAVALPIGKEPDGWSHVWWTADERFLVAAQWNDQILVIPTKLPPRPSILASKDALRSEATTGASPPAALDRDLRVFQPTSWWDVWVHPNTFVARYEDGTSNGILFSTGPAGAVYRYDALKRDLILVDQGTWDRAAGSYSADVLGRTVEDLWKRTDEVLKWLYSNVATTEVPSLDWQIKDCISIAKVAGKQPQAYRPSPSKDCVMMIMNNPEDDAKYVVEFFDPRYCLQLGRPVRIPKPIWQDLGDMMWLPDCKYVLFENYDLRYFSILHGDRLIEAHSEVGPRRESMPSSILTTTLDQDLRVFQPASWADAWVHPSTFAVRYMSPRSDVILFSTGPEGAVYQYDPDSPDLIPVDQETWDRATGVTFGPTDIFPPEPLPTAEELEVRFAKGDIPEYQKGNERSQIDYHLHCCNRRDKTGGKRQQSFRVPPSKRHVLVVSDNADEDSDYIVEFFEPMTIKKRGRTIRIPKAVWKELGNMIWLPDCKYVLFENYDKRLFSILHGARLTDPRSQYDFGRD